ncbi:MAG: hypothetical protein M4579_000887 [Chaenotheca gracillima]|nr:MAG: hypothetical protein M4579_000887 [Chaenotheca gracillima]
MTTSFKKPQNYDRHALSRYRTPSPPPHRFKEPLSPIHAEREYNAHDANVASRDTGREPHARTKWRERMGQISTQNSNVGSLDGRHARGNSNGILQSPTSAMDAFASIALATSPTFDSATEGFVALKDSPAYNQEPRSKTTFGNGYGMDNAEGLEERPSKRARSEVPLRKNTPLYTSRPATSHTPYTERVQGFEWRANNKKDQEEYDHHDPNGVAASSTDDAELLLNVSRAAFTSNGTRTYSLPGIVGQENFANGNSSRVSSIRLDAPPGIDLDMNPSISTFKAPQKSGTAAQDAGTWGDVQVQNGAFSGLAQDNGIAPPMQTTKDASTLQTAKKNDNPSMAHAGAKEIISQGDPKPRQPGINRGSTRGKSRGGRGTRAASGRTSYPVINNQRQSKNGPAKNNKGSRGRSDKNQSVRDLDLHNAQPTQSHPQRRNSMPNLSHQGKHLNSDRNIDPSTYGAVPRRRASDPGLTSTSHLLDDVETLGKKTVASKARRSQHIATCAGCEMSPNSLGSRPDAEEVSWIGCDACKRWFHYACAGFASEKEVRSVDKYICAQCKKEHGPTTYVRKSTRTHTAIDYAGLNEGVVKTSDETQEHPYIAPIKEGTIRFLPESFARLPPELITLEFFEKGSGMKEPVVIPASLNPKRKTIFTTHQAEKLDAPDETMLPLPETDALSDGHFIDECSQEKVRDDGQDGLDMVIPQGLTVRRVAELYGPEEKVDVIDVKSQGEDGRWKMSKWADYYENVDKKFIRNVISLEVSTSLLGRLIKRPRVVRDMDLVDSVWPAELKAKGDFPKVQFYCLMSVADSYTDFHIDFGGSSVFYHILKGKKTFFFIPPKSKHLKKYEQWCLSPAQNQTFLPDQTKECYRVDLSEGDTMLIPSGWIHAVWTPEDSLVIGGNFLTRLHFAMQIQIAEIEKNTRVPLKFRHPHFQRVLWFTAIRYLRDDPLPADVIKVLQDGETFRREIPPHHEFDRWGPNSKPGPENWQKRYYSQYELEGLPHLIRFLLRTALIFAGKIEGITQDVRQRVSRAIPKGHGDPIDLIKELALWAAWKRGNESIPSWAYPNADPGDDLSLTNSEKKGMSARAIKKMEREAAMESKPKPPQRQSERRQSHAQVGGVKLETEPTASQTTVAELSFSKSGPEDPSLPSIAQTQTPPPKTSSKRSVLGPKRMACDECRKRRIGCKHKGTSEEPSQEIKPTQPVRDPENVAPAQNVHSQIPPPLTQTPNPQHNTSLAQNDGASSPGIAPASFDGLDFREQLIQNAASDSAFATPSSRTQSTTHATSASSLSSSKKARSKACDDCRKSKRRCIHDDNGNVDIVKVQEANERRLASSAKRRRPTGDKTVDQSAKKLKLDKVEPTESSNKLEGSDMINGQTLNAIGNTSKPLDVVLHKDQAVKHEDGVHVLEPAMHYGGTIDEHQKPSKVTSTNTSDSLEKPSIEPQPSVSPRAPVTSEPDLEDTKAVKGSGPTAMIHANLSPDDGDDGVDPPIPSQDVNGSLQEPRQEPTPPQQKLLSPPSSPLSEHDINPLVELQSKSPEPAQSPASRRSSPRTSRASQQLPTATSNGTTPPKRRTSTSKAPNTKLTPASLPNGNSKNGEVEHSNLAVVVETKGPSDSSSGLSGKEEEESWKAAKLAEFSLRKRRALN